MLQNREYQDIITRISPEEANDMIERVARFIVERQMAPAGILLIESVRPLHSIGSQVLYFFLPFAEILFNSQKYQKFALMIQNGEYLKQLLNRIDELDEELNRERRKQSRIKRIRRRNQFKSFMKRLFVKDKNKSAE